MTRFEDSFEKDLCKRMRHSLYQTLSPQAHLLLAVSGGSDSLGMMFLMSKIWPSNQLSVGFVDHRLRSGVDAEWKWVNQCAAKLSISAKNLHVVQPYAKSKCGAGIQQWAREQRYNLLKNMAREMDACAILTAHTQDDQAETVLLRLLRGTGLDGLRAVNPVLRIESSLDIIRPMLDISRAEIRRWLQSNNIDWCEDPSNENDRFARVQVRKSMPILAQMNPGVQSHLCQLANEARDMTSWIEKELCAQKYMKTCNYNGGLHVDSDVFEEVPRFLWGRVVRSVLGAQQGNLLRFGRDHVDAICQGLERKDGSRQYSVPGNLDVRTVYGGLFVFPVALPQQIVSYQQKLKRCATNMWKGELKKLGISICIATDDANNDLGLLKWEIRTAVAGDRIIGSSKKVSRILINNRIPSFYRQLVPVLVSEKNEVISIPSLLKSQISGLRIEWELTKDCGLRDVRQFAVE